MQHTLLAMFTCCCTEEDDKALELKPVGISALSSGPVMDACRSEVDDVHANAAGAMDEPFSAALAPRSKTSPSQHALEPENTFDNEGPPQPPVQLKDPVCFDVDLDHGQGGLGARLFVMPTTLAISLIVSGSIEAHNKAHPERAVLQNDFLRAVNGQTTVREMAEILKSKTATRLSIYRPPPIHLKVDKAGRSAGIMVHCLPGHGLIHIQGFIDGGAISSHNAAKPAEQHVKVHDCISCINGVEGDCVEMMKILQDPRISCVELKLLRPMLPDEAG